MPIFEFDCQDCGQSFEELVRSVFAIPEVTCPECGSSEIKKKVSAFSSRLAGGGAGFYSSGANCSTGGG